MYGISSIASKIKKDWGLSGREDLSVETVQIVFKVLLGMEFSGKVID